MSVYFFAFLIFLIGVFGSYLAFVGSRSSKIDLFACFSRGVFFGLAIIHFLPEAFEYALISNKSIVTIMVAAALCYYFLQFLSKVIISHRIKYSCSDFHWCLYLVFVLLMLHCIIEGGAIVFSHDFWLMIIAVIGVCLHKASVAFAITSSFISSKIKNNSIIFMVGLFLLSTPLSMVFFNYSLHSFLSPDFLCWVQVLAFSTFLYIAVNHHLCYSANECSKCDFKDVLWFGYGLFVIILVALIG